MQDSQLSAVLKRKARELITWEGSLVQAAVLPAQVALLATVAARLLVATGGGRARTRCSRRSSTAKKCLLNPNS